MTLSDKIKMLRKSKGLKIAQLAEIMRVSNDAVSRWEHGMRIPELDNLIKLADAFDVSLDVFRQDAQNIDLPHPFFAKKVKKQDIDELSNNGIPLRFGSIEPNEKQKQILDFCYAYLETLDDWFFVKGVAQNSEYGTGRYFWERQIDMLMFIGFTPSFEKLNSDYSFSICVNTEVPLSEEYLFEFDCLQVTDNSEENWIYIPIKCDLKKEIGKPYPKILRESTDNALAIAMKIARKSLEISMQKFILLKSTSNHTKDLYFEQI